MINVLITGAFGSVGFCTIKKLLEMGNFKITAFDLKTKKTIKLYKRLKGKITVIWGSITSRDEVIKIVEGQDLIIHLAAIIPPRADLNEEITKKVNYEGTKNIVDGIVMSKSKPFLVYSSSIAVYGDRIDSPYIKTTDELKPGSDYYSKTKILSEDYIRESGINYTIYRFTAIMGLPKPDPLMFHMPLDTKLEIASVNDTARALALSYEHKDELNQKIFNLSGGEACRTTYREFLKKMFEIYGIDYDKVVNEEAFANYNFHCGYYIDGDLLENIIHFRQDSLDDYLKFANDSLDSIVKALGKIFGNIYYKFVQTNSEPLQAKKNKDLVRIKKYFK